MADWKYVINLGPAYDERSGQTFAEYRDGIVKILKGSAWFRGSQYSWILSDYVHDLTLADDRSWFDTVMDGIQDLAKEDRCLICVSSV